MSKKQPPASPEAPKAYVWITTAFAAIHRWPGAPESKEYLMTPHRHVFHVKAWAPVQHDDRDIEFIDLKEQIEHFLQQRWGVFAKDMFGGHYAYCKNIGTTSCEQIARAILNEFSCLSRVSVSEDNENGAEVWR